jgi:hypothetical protein
MIFWVLFGDFNFISKKSEITGISYQSTLNNKFNKFINDKHLLELSLVNRQFIWAKSYSSSLMALLDRFLCTIS